MFVTQHTHGACGEREQAPILRRQTQPAARENAEYVPVCEKEHIARTSGYIVDYCLSSGCNQLEAFSAGNSVLP
jgi:hypothetical protein